MNRFVYILFFIFLSQISFAQEVFSNGGDEFISSDAKISFTIGETIISNYSDSNTQLSQGFHANPKIVISEVNSISELYDISYFPNPTTSFLQMNCPNLSAGEALSFKLFSQSGQLIKSVDLTERENTLDLTLLSNGYYLIQISKDSKLIHTSKLLKNE